MLGYLEFCAFLRKLGLDLPPSQMRHMFRMFDEASNGARRDAPRTYTAGGCTARLLRTPPPPRPTHPLDSPVAGVITLFEFCHHVFPDLDVERLAKEGLIDLDTHGTPRLLSDAESNSAKSKRSKRKTGKDDAEVGTPPRRAAHTPAPRRPRHPTGPPAASLYLSGRPRPRRRRR